jgi:hypothetical protein
MDVIKANIKSCENLPDTQIVLNKPFVFWLYESAFPSKVGAKRERIVSKMNISQVYSYPFFNYLRLLYKDDTFR